MLRTITVSAAPELPRDGVLQLQCLRVSLVLYLRVVFIDQAPQKALFADNAKIFSNLHSSSIISHEASDNKVGKQGGSVNMASSKSLCVGSGSLRAKEKTQVEHILLLSGQVLVSLCKLPAPCFRRVMWSQPTT